MNQMTPFDWEKVHSNWEESLVSQLINEPRSEEEFKRQYLHEPIVESKDTFTKDHLGTVGNGSPKAKFYLTESSMSGDFGFWCPKAAIVSESETQVEIANWCNIKVIEYNRY